MLLVCISSFILEISKFQLFFFLQSFAVLSDKLEPLVDGVRNNKQMWLQMASEDNPDEENENEQEN